jgi:hypothetical protein
MNLRNQIVIHLNDVQNRKQRLNLYHLYLYLWA